VWLLSNSDSGCGGGNGDYNACAPCGSPCGDSVYGTYDHHVDDVFHLPIPGYPSLHLLSEEPLLFYEQGSARFQGYQQSSVIQIALDQQL
jgi:hypothetical protein